MIITEPITLANGKIVYRHYSNENRSIIQEETGLEFVVADDSENKYTYSEGSILQSYIEEQEKQIDETFTDNVIEEALSSEEYSIASEVEIKNN